MVLILAAVAEAATGGEFYILDGHKRVDDRYWFRTWGARGLLYVWEDSALPIDSLLHDEVRHALRRGSAIAPFDQTHDQPVAQRPLRLAQR